MSLLKVAGTTASSGTLYVDDVFSTYLYTGTGAAQTITNGIDLAGKGGLVWTKSRSNATTHVLTDSARGLTNPFYTIATDPQASGITTTITSFNSNGFSLGDDSQLDRVNVVSNTYASWTFREAAKFFDVVTYTGTGSARTIAHSLGIAPGMVIVKCTDTTGNWQVYHRSLTSAAYSIQLNLIAAEASASTVWNSTAPTSSVFSVGTDSTVNASGGTYVAYLFAHDTSSTGIIQCGSFTDPASGGTTEVNLGYEPQWLLVKPNLATTDWYLIDNMRGMVRGTQTKILYPDSSSVEDNGFSNAYYQPTATGFTAGNTVTGGGGTTCIYMAIRMPNKPPTTGTQVFEPSTRAGTGATATTTNLTFPLDMVWSKGRDNGGTNSGDFDRLRGATNQLSLNQGDGETTAATSLTGFDVMTGYAAGADATQLTINATGYNYANWAFQRAPGFFDEVCYTGTGVARTVAHNLTVVPEMMITKQRSGSNNWFTYHASIGATGWVALNLPNASVSSSLVWNDTAPTSTVFTVGTASNNTSGATLVAYLFATLAGISKVGSYTGNGTGQAIACGFSAGARFVLIKRTDSTGDWYTFDSARGLTVGSSPYLLLNSTAAEVTGNNGVYASTGGFTLDATAITTTNIATATYIFLAVA